ncbi:hypothetical protein N7455_003944 [Penicillium solitum]|uniref:uncharacterized protein n=1 Tax=Penicillium solitum TaxID=60172 RepID=UPI0032C474B7|nr:hypothetical protein N7455_003944 [Penicillium solitum]
MSRSARRPRIKKESSSLTPAAFSDHGFLAPAFMLGLPRRNATPHKTIAPPSSAYTIHTLWTYCLIYGPTATPNQECEDEIENGIEHRCYDRLLPRLHRITKAAMSPSKNSNPHNKRDRKGSVMPPYLVGAFSRTYVVLCSLTVKEETYQSASVYPSSSPAGGRANLV